MSDDFSIEMAELNSLVVDLAAGGARIGAGAAAAVRKTTLDTQRTAQAFVPVDTGNLKNTIGSDFEGDGGSGTIEGVTGPTADYGAHVEFGTVRMAPHAYMGPAMDRHAPELEAALGQLADRLL